MVIVDLATGTEVTRMPTETTCGYDMHAMTRDDKTPKYADKACPKQEAAKAAKNRIDTDAVLAALGFVIVPKVYVDIRDDKGDRKKEVVGPDGTKVVIADKAKVIAKGKTKEIELDPDHTWGVAFLPNAVLVVRRSQGKIMEGCDAADGYNRVE